MHDQGPGSYGEAFADVYDRWYRDVTDAEACVTCLVDLADEAGPVLELGVGTGRLALPLARRGLAVTGVDASASMLAVLGAKPGADGVRVVLGDMADLDASPLDAAPRPATWGPPYALAFVAYNTLFNLLDGRAQARCLAGLAARSRPTGRVVLETFVPTDPDPDDARVAASPPAGAADPPPVVSVSRRSATELVLTSSRHDPRSQTVQGQHLQLTGAGLRVRPWRLHYQRPDQLDRLAAGAGLVLEARWGDWRRGPFDRDSPTAISVYRLAPVP